MKDRWEGRWQLPVDGALVLFDLSPDVVDGALPNQQELEETCTRR
jgi:hypothetical protein